MPLRSKIREKYFLLFFGSFLLCFGQQLACCAVCVGRPEVAACSAT